MDMRKNVIVMASVIIWTVVLAIVPIFYAYYLERNASIALQASAVANPTVTGDNASRIIAKVARAEKIPKDEMPTVVLVTDTTLLKPFGQVRPGDYILLYHQSDLAVVFDEVTNRIINAVSVNIKNPNAK